MPATRSAATALPSAAGTKGPFPEGRILWDGPPRVATPVAWSEAPPAPLPDPALASMVREFPEPALVFSRRCVCTCLNDAAARDLGVHPDRSVGLGAVALGLPTEVADAILELTDPRRRPAGEEREVVIARGTGLRHFSFTPRPGTGEVLLTWSDLPGPHEAARQLATLRATLSTLRDRALADGLRRRDALVRLGAQLEAAVAALGAVNDELGAPGWCLPPDRTVADVLNEASSSLRTVRAELARLALEPPDTTALDDDVLVEL